MRAIYSSRYSLLHLANTDLRLESKVGLWGEGSPVALLPEHGHIVIPIPAGVPAVRHTRVTEYRTLRERDER